MSSLTSFSFGLGLFVATTSVSALPAAEQDTRATVLVVDGVALVGTRDRVSPAEQGTRLQIADRIFVLDDSSATLEFADGCRQELPANTILTIGDQGTCQGDTASLTEQARAMERYATGQLGSGEAPGPVAAAAAPRRAAALFPLSGSAALLPVVGFVGVGALAALTNDDNNSSSPVAPQQPPVQPPLSPE